MCETFIVCCRCRGVEKYSTEALERVKRMDERILKRPVGDIIKKDTEMRRKVGILKRRANSEKIVRILRELLNEGGKFSYYVQLNDDGSIDLLYDLLNMKAAEC